METNVSLALFFDAYEARFNNALSDQPFIDAEATAAAFAEHFIESSPVGVICGKNDARFREQIPKGMEFYRSIGTKSMNIKARTITELDKFHSMVRMQWQASYRKKNDLTDTIDFEVIYLVRIDGNKPEIFAYITGDEQQALRDHGLIPDEKSA